MASDEGGVRRIADALVGARVAVRPIPAPSGHGADVPDLVTAYRVQQRIDAMARIAGDHPAGYKVGLTSGPGRAAFGAVEPVRGTLTRSMIRKSGAELKLRTFVAPKVEAEIAFVMGRELCGRGISEREAAAAVASVAPALEVVDSRVVGWACTAVDLVADAGAAAAAVLGEPVPFSRQVALPDRCVLEHDGRHLPGSPAAVDGGPLASLVWLVGHLAAYNSGLRPGDIVLSGTWTNPMPVASRTETSADFGPLGVVRASFI